MPLIQLQQWLPHKHHFALSWNGPSTYQEMGWSYCRTPATKKELPNKKLQLPVDVCVLEWIQGCIWVLNFLLDKAIKLNELLELTLELAREGERGSWSLLFSRKTRSISMTPFGSIIWKALARISLSCEYKQFSHTIDGRRDGSLRFLGKVVLLKQWNNIQSNHCMMNGNTWRKTMMKESISG